MLIFLQFSIGTRAVVRSSRHRPFFSFYQKYATRISVCVIAVSKSQKSLFQFRRLSLFFSTTPQGIRLRRQVDVFSTTSDTNHESAAVRLWWSRCNIFRLTFRQSRPNKAGLRCPSVNLSVRSSVHKKFLRFQWCWRVGRGRWVMHDGMQYDPI